MIQSATEMAKCGELRRGEYSIPLSSGRTLNQRSSGSQMVDISSNCFWITPNWQFFVDNRRRIWIDRSGDFFRVSFQVIHRRTKGRLVICLAFRQISYMGILMKQHFSTKKCRFGYIIQLNTHKCIYELQPKFSLMGSSIRYIFIYWKLSWGLENDNTVFKS